MKLLVIASFEMRTFWVLISTVVQQLGCSLAQWVSRQPHTTAAQVWIQPAALCCMSSRFLFSPPYHYPIKVKMSKNIMSAYNTPSLVVHSKLVFHCTLTSHFIRYTVFELTFALRTALILHDTEIFAPNWQHHTLAADVSAAHPLHNTWHISKVLYWTEICWLWRPFVYSDLTVMFNKPSEDGYINECRWSALIFR